MQQYSLLREDLDNLMEICQWPNQELAMKGVDAKVKAAFTRMYNKEIVLPYATNSGNVAKKRMAATTIEDEILNEEEDVDDDENDDDISADAMIKAKKPSKAKESKASEKAGKGEGKGKGGKGGKRSKK